MMKRWIIAGMGTAVFLGLFSHAQAQTPVPIRNVVRTPGITIAGEITSIVGNEFILSDGTGQLIVDAGPAWYQPLNLQVGEELIITGEYDDYDFDAYLIVRANGEVIVIRTPGGPPPWAGDPLYRR